MIPCANFGGSSIRIVNVIDFVVPIPGSIYKAFDLDRVRVITDLSAGKILAPSECGIPQLIRDGGPSTVCNLPKLGVIDQL